MKYQEILFKIQNGEMSGENLFKLRIDQIKKVEAATGRPLIVYAAKLDVPREAPNHIVLDDLLGFSDLIADIDGPSIDVFIESPGGIVDAAHRIVHLLRQKYSSIRFLIAGSAYSAATMIALSGNEILMHESASLGPIDPQINGIPARSILNGFEAVRERLKADGASALPAYLPLLQKYDLHILEICKDAEERGKVLVREWLENYMFKGEKDASSTAKTIVDFFADYNTHKSHARPIFCQDMQKLGIKASILEPPLKQDVWDLYILMKIMLDVSTNVKLFENSRGVNWGKQFIPAGAIVHQVVPPKK